MHRMLAFLLTISLVGCIDVVARQPVASGGRYVCEDGKMFMVELVGDGSTAEVTYEDKKITLPQAIGGTDMKYSDGQTTVYLDGPRALLEMNGMVFARGCVQR